MIHLVFFTVAASAPLTILGGGVTTTFAVTGNAGVPLSFLILAIALALFAVGYAAMSRHVANAGAFYSYLARGLGRPAAAAGAFVALLSYNGIQIGLYGLFGAAFGDFAKATFGLDLAWWIWAFLALVLVSALGVLRVDLNAAVLAVLLGLKCIAVLLYDIGAFGNPAGPGVAAAGFNPSELFVPGVGAVFAFGIAAIIGFESGAIYSEECRDPRRTVGRATYVALAFTGIFYAISAWAMTIAVGPANLQQAATENGPGLVFGALAEYWGPAVADIANVLFLTSVFAALLSFHNGVARYLFALGRERVLPEFLDTRRTPLGRPGRGLVRAELHRGGRTPRLHHRRLRPDPAAVHLVQRAGRGRRGLPDGGHLGRGRRLLRAAARGRDAVAAGHRAGRRGRRTGRPGDPASGQRRVPALHNRSTRWPGAVTAWGTSTTSTPCWPTPRPSRAPWSNAICLHEEDAGVLWKHTDLFTESAETRRQRRLVISFFVTVGNYDYGFYWYLYLDGTIELEEQVDRGAVHLCLPWWRRRRVGSWSTEVAPGLGAPLHQHLFSARPDMTVDGVPNAVDEIDVRGADRARTTRTATRSAARSPGCQ